MEWPSAEVLAWVAATAESAGPWTILIDGRSGAGKTTLAAQWQRQLSPRTEAGAVVNAEPYPEASTVTDSETSTKTGRPLQVVHLDDLYPGWDGLQEGSRIVAESVLRADNPGFYRWDWYADRNAEWVALDPTANLIIEGAGALTNASVRAAKARVADPRANNVLSVWVELESEERKRRALLRPDGEGFAPFWDKWAQQEEVHLRTLPPVDLVIPAP